MFRVFINFILKNNNSVHIFIQSFSAHKVATPLKLVKFSWWRYKHNMKVVTFVNKYDMSYNILSCFVIFTIYTSHNKAYLSQISSHLHGDKAQVILLVTPHQEGLIFIVVDTTAGGPESASIGSLWTNSYLT